MKLGRRQFITAAGVTGIAGLAGCSGGPSSDATPTDTDGDSGDDSDGGGTETDGGANAATNVGIVYATGGLGDGSFNDQAQQGLQQAESAFDLQTNSLQPQEVSEFASLQQQFASSTDPSYDLISCIGFLQADALGGTATQYPDQDFQIVDSVPTNDDDEQYDNVASYTFREHEGSYLAGTMAGLLTLDSFSAGAGETGSDSTNLGFVGGVESSLIQKFEAGFMAGANAVNTDIDVQTNYTGSFNDPSAGREAASSMYSSGSDIVFHAAGNTGTGVFQAAQEAGKFAIGVDRDQSVTRESYADVILASMVKRVDTAVYSAVEAKVNDSFETGSTTTLGLDDNGVELVLGQQLGGELPDSIVTEVESTRQSIIDGEIDVPSDPSNV
ncbi:BMP family lipoprotein [Halosegnis rubeus]|jgi:basic membrane protein A|uniref:BMP family lipoprotein n=1 Tax=Halosegnis rubeus TaxID=2212850 RepID=UPI0015625E13|nr:BMP family protein [Halosegnis rubeus]